MPGTLSISVDSRSDRVAVMRFAGRLDFASAPKTRDQFAAAIADGRQTLIVDLSKVAFVDSAGLEALVDVTEKLNQAGRSLKICGANQTVRAVLRLTGVAGSFEFYDEVNAGVRSFL